MIHQRCSVPLEEKEGLLRGQAWVGEGRTCGRINKGDAGLSSREETKTSEEREE